MKIISWNVNGIRAACRKGFLDWFKKENADIVCLQEIKAQMDNIPSDLLALSKPALFTVKSYHGYFSTAHRPGCWGVGVFSKEEPLNVERKIGLARFDQEGRVLKLRYPKFTLFNLYFPHGGRDKENMGYKLQVNDYLLDYLQKNKGEPMILAGDFNVAHTELDLARPQDNKNNTMFTKEEREKLNCLVGLGFVDTFRYFHKEGGHHTWWLTSFNERKRNIGWRIDYIFVSRNLAPQVKNGFILPNVMGSDHCPVGIEIKV